jgi:hypothetical protein
MARAGGRGRNEDAVLTALDDLVDALGEAARIKQAADRRVKQIKRQREKGQSYSDIIGATDGPLLVELMRQNTGRLIEVGSRLQRTEARALYDEGMTMEQIARRFGVTRQRVSMLLRRDTSG